jgi:hypothetical protein
MRATGGANWNVTAMTVLDTTLRPTAASLPAETRSVCGESRITGRVIERYWYSPYGQLEAVVAAHPFDYP